MSNEEEKDFFVCKKTLSPSVFFVCTLGNELSKLKPDDPVNFAEMQDALIALAKNRDIDLDKKGMFHILESYLSKSGTDDARQSYREAFNIAVQNVKKEYPSLISAGHPRNIERL